MIQYGYGIRNVFWFLGVILGYGATVILASFIDIYCISLASLFIQVVILMEMNERHTFEDFPGIVAYFREQDLDPIAFRKWGPSYWLIIEENGKVICKQFTPESEALDIHEAVKGIMDDRKRNEKIRLGICPDCGKTLTDDRIRSGCHKGHGRIYCSHCGGVKIRI